VVDLVAYIRSASPLPVTGPLHVLPGRAEQGHRLFVEKRCSDCHGVAGRGATVGPDLAERGVHQSLTQFAAAMWNKAPTMLAAMKARGIAVPRLEAEEMADIVAYLYAVQYFAQPRDTQRGARLARDKGCLGCHTVHARDAKPPIDLAQSAAADSPAGVVGALWNHSFVRESAGRPAAGWAALRGDELADLVAFLRSLRPSRP
jgi:mono/diheme cytochrome c family protein